MLDGDGSVLMNLGTLATLARYRPKNLVHIIFDNGSLLSTGGFDSHTTSGITDLAAIARGAGIEHVAAVDSVMDFGEAVIDAFARRRSERDRREGRRRRPEPLRHGPAAAGERVPIQAVDRRTEEDLRDCTSVTSLVAAGTAATAGRPPIRGRSREWLRSGHRLRARVARVSSRR